MAGLWFYGHDGRKLGPCSPQELRDLATAGTIQPTDTIWKEGVEQGALARNVKNLFLPEPKPLSDSEALAAIPTIPLVAAEEQAVALSPVGPEHQVEASAAPAPTIEDLVPASGEQAVIVPEPTTKPVPIQPPKKHVQKARAVALRGAILVAQDGRIVQFKKKCTTCGLEDACRSTLPIRTGVMRASFFCRHCKRVRQAEIQGIT